MYIQSLKNVLLFSSTYQTERESWQVLQVVLKQRKGKERKIRELPISRKLSRMIKQRKIFSGRGLEVLASYGTLERLHSPNLSKVPYEVRTYFIIMKYQFNNFQMTVFGIGLMANTSFHIESFSKWPSDSQDPLKWFKFILNISANG